MIIVMTFLILGTSIVQNQGGTNFGNLPNLGGQATKFQGRVMPRSYTVGKLLISIFQCTCKLGETRGTRTCIRSCSHTLFSKRNATFLKMPFFWRKVCASETGVIHHFDNAHGGLFQVTPKTI